jgi:hypothetical protein
MMSIPDVKPWLNTGHLLTTRFRPALATRIADLLLDTMRIADPGLVLGFLHAFAMRIADLLLDIMRIADPGLSRLFAT